MSIRFTCPACRGVLKIGEAISESKKVRCTGCGIVLLVSPDENNPEIVSATIPKKPSRREEVARSGARQQAVLFGGAAVVLLTLVFVFWMIFKAPGDRAEIEGRVMLDDLPMESGTIKFIPLDTTKTITAEGPITRGRYSISAANGPVIGMNRVEVYSTGEKAVSTSYNTKSHLTFDVQPGSNPKDFDVKSR